jgi:hypothetical protein
MDVSNAPYHLRLRQHLEQYKREVLGVFEDGTWSYRGRRISYPHILPVAQQRLNVLGGVREEFWAYWQRQGRAEPRPAKLHRNFAHLTSSQALAFNIFYPFLGSSHADPDALLAALGIEPEPVRAWRFEEVLDVEEGTNFDVSIVLSSGRRILVEVKLTETEFGVCRDDQRHRDKLDGIYLRRLAGKVNPETVEPAAFFSRYQILRNISYASVDTEVVFLFPRQNEALSGGSTFIGKAVLAPYRHQVRTVHLEDLLARLTGSSVGQGLKQDLAELTCKYLPTSGAPATVG